MKILLWYVAIGMVVTFLDIMNEKRKNSRIYNELIESISHEYDEYCKTGFICGFVSVLSLFWPINLMVSFIRFVRDISK